MAELTKAQQREWAGMLYTRENYTQAEIAEKVGVSRQTINRWAKEEKWEERKVGITQTREYQIDNWYRQLAEVNAEIMKRPPGQRFPTPAEADTQAKIAKNIKSLENESGIADLISAGTRFIKYVRNIDLERAKEVTRLYDAFIKENL